MKQGFVLQMGEMEQEDSWNQILSVTNFAELFDSLHVDLLFFLKNTQ